MYLACDIHLRAVVAQVFAAHSVIAHHCNKIFKTELLRSKLAAISL
jgi:hypothetical protein